MAFESLTEKLSGIFKKLRGQSNLTESNMDDMLKEIKIALLEADVNFKVVKEFLENVKEKSIGQKVITSVNPSQMIVKIVHDEIQDLLGSDDCELKINNNKPTCIMLVGLQGTGKTTTIGKLAYYFKNKLKKKVLLAAGDVYRPAAVDQLDQLAKQVGVDIVNMGTNVSPIEIAKTAKEKAYNDHYDFLLIDTAGRLQIDEVLMDELFNIQKSVSPEEVLLLIDASSGQDAVNVANSFNSKIRLTGAVMSKLDGDARGGAALSIRHLTGIPIKFQGIGEKVTDLEPFYPDRMADRILGMGDVVSLVEKAQEVMDEKEAKRTVDKMMDGDFTLEDMLDQMKKIQKMGSFGGILKLIPGMPKISDEQKATAEKEMKVFEVIINSMTPEERRHPDIIKNSRKVRISRGCGQSPHEINKVLTRFEKSKEMMKMVKGGGLKGLKNFGNMNGFGPH